MPARALAERLRSRPAWVCAALALAVRTTVVLHAWATNPLVREPELDGPYYLRWAKRIADGDLAGTQGHLASGAWVLNPLYAYVLAPFAAFFGVETGTREGVAFADLAPAQHLPVLLFQAVLGAATTALAAGAARRWFGVRAAWAAGLLTAFSAVLAHLDTQVAVAELAAFLVAGACFACAPAAPGDRPGAHGPVAAGLWLGIGALARPVTVLALPLVAWRFATPRRRNAVVLVAVFAACAVPSLARNWWVSGDPVVYTAAGGINAHLGNNPEARRYRTMTSPHFRFNPVEMHEDARRYVHEATGREPAQDEVSAWFWKTTVDEWVRAPAASALHTLHKVRWFLGPAEVPSSASLSLDVRYSPLLRLAFVPTWLIAALAVAGAWVHRRRPDVLLGPTALAAAHLAMLTLVFPLSHYRAPAVPALAVLAGGAVAAAWDRWAAGRRRGAAALVGVAAAAAVVGAVPPQPDPLRARDERVLALRLAADGDLEAAERQAHVALATYREQWGEEAALDWELLGDLRERARRWEGARDAYARSLEIAPKEPFVRYRYSLALERTGDFAGAEREARRIVEEFPLLPDGHERLGELLTRLPGRSGEARAAADRGRELRRAMAAAARDRGAAKRLDVGR